jgi:hypothetical protein
MSQILHIFRKDSRRFWPEIAVSVAVIAVLAWVGPYGWTPEFLHRGSRASSQKMLAVVAYLPLLVVATWGLLITRVVQAESLVGETQFWVTRPYEWKKLLAAKALFLGVYLYLPLVMMQCVLLSRAGFAPRSHIGGLTGNLLLLTGEVVVPIFAIACVTASLARMALTILGIFGCLGAYFASELLLMPVNGAVLPPTLIWPALCVVLCGIAVVLQYSARTTWVARVVLLSAPVLLFVVAELPPYSVDRVYAQQGGGNHAAVELAYSPRPHERFPASLRTNKEIDFGIPVSVVETADHTIPVIENVKIAIEAADGSRWVSSWEGTWGVLAGPGAVNLVIPRAEYERYRGNPVTLELTLAVEQARVQSSARIPLAEPGTAALGDGICLATSSLSSDANFSRQNVNVECRYPLRQPQLTHMALVWDDPACSPTGSGSGSWGSLDGAPAYFAINPVVAGPVMGQGVSNAVMKDGARVDCPASAIMFEQYELAGRVQTTLTIQNFQLPSLTQESGQ